MSEYVVRPAVPEDLDAISRVFRDAFGMTGAPDPADSVRTVIEPERYLVPEHEGEIVGTAGILTRDMSIPGAVIPVAHVTAVSVAATHTRRGLLRRMMTEQITGAPEAVAALWASEGRIYQRFGYGLASQNVTFRADRRELSLRVPAAGSLHSTGSLRSAVPSAVIEELAQVYSRVLPTRIGWSSRDEKWWKHLTDDPETRRDGKTAMRAVLYSNAAGEVDGYARYRIRSDWDDNGPKQEVNVTEVVAATAEAYAELYRFLLRIDLARTLVQGCASVDEPIFHLVDEPRQLGAKVGDGLWVRILDLPRALTARRYAAPIDVVLEVTDAIVPGNAGLWRLRAGAGGALVTCAPAGDGAAADITLDVADLGAAYLGGTRLGALHLAGRIVEHRPGAVAAASTAFGWAVTPSSIEIF
jgi:predicted acetyltransferase